MSTVKFTKVKNAWFYTIRPGFEQPRAITEEILFKAFGVTGLYETVVMVPDSKGGNYKVTINNGIRHVVSETTQEIPMDITEFVVRLGSVNTTPKHFNNLKYTISSEWFIEELKLKPHLKTDIEIGEFFIAKCEEVAKTLHDYKETNTTKAEPINLEPQRGEVTFWVIRTDPPQQNNQRFEPPVNFHGFARTLSEEWVKWKMTKEGITEKEALQIGAQKVHPRRLPYPYYTMRKTINFWAVI